MFKDVKFNKITNHMHDLICQLADDKILPIVIQTLANQLDIARRRVETVFSQLFDKMILKRNYAKTFVGLRARIISKVAAVTLLQSIIYNRPYQSHQTCAGCLILTE